MAIRLVTKSGNDYVPELEAVTPDEFGTIFENPPNPRSFRVNQLVTNTFRYLGAVNTGEMFYVFARLDPYEQAALMEGKDQTERKSQTEVKSQTGNPQAGDPTAKGLKVGETSTRPRRSTPR
jgi:hypothetical protein